MTRVCTCGSSSVVHGILPWDPYSFQIFILKWRFSLQVLSSLANPAVYTVILLYQWWVYCNITAVPYLINVMLHVIQLLVGLGVKLKQASTVFCVFIIERDSLSSLDGPGIERFCRSRILPLTIGNLEGLNVRQYMSSPWPCNSMICPIPWTDGQLLLCVHYCLDFRFLFCIADLSCTASDHQDGNKELYLVANPTPANILACCCVGMSIHLSSIVFFQSQCSVTVIISRHFSRLISSVELFEVYPRFRHPFSPSLWRFWVGRRF